jgi:hypothetical protein
MHSSTSEIQPSATEACKNFKDEIIASLDGLENTLKSTTKRVIWTVAIIQFIAIVGTIWAALYYLNF